jgi:hypothetical protein
VNEVKTSRHWFHFALCLLWALSGTAQVPGHPDIPPQFKLDMETAARLRPQLIAASVAVSGRYAPGRLVFQRLVEEAEAVSPSNLPWQLRIVKDDQFNAYASPDGTVYVESGLADVAGSSPGLWAAILSHEIAHVIRRDWARRYLFQKQLEGAGTTIILGDPGVMSGEWTDSGKASAEMGEFCRQMEIEADREGLMLMAKAGYHPDFVPALHHLLHARGSSSRSTSLYAMHPCWQERDRELATAYQRASIEFEHLWPEWYASPGGNPPVVVFADPPAVKKTGSKQWEIQVAMSCQNLAGAVEVVRRADSDRKEAARLGQLSLTENSDDEVRQLTGCTSARTVVAFTAAELAPKQKADTRWTDIYVIDASGTVLARSDLPKLPR